MRSRFLRDLELYPISVYYTSRVIRILAQKATSRDSRISSDVWLDSFPYVDNLPLDENARNVDLE